MVYESIELAAKAALVAAYLCGHQDYECGSVLYQGPEGYSFSAPVTDRKPFGVEIPQLSEPPPAGLKIVGDAHNHICNTHNKMFAAYFSPADGMVNQGFNVIGYMLDGCSGNIHSFDPNEWPREVMVVHFTSGRELELPIGHIVGWLDLRSLK
jgi:hypothetical protein